MLEPWDFSQIRPSFLDLFDSNKSEAMKQFGLGFDKHFREFHPRDFHRLEPDLIEDLKSDLKVHCLKDDFRVLRKYVAGGKSFSHWFTVISHNRFVDVLRARKATYSIDTPIDDEHTTAEPAANEPNSEVVTFFRQLLRYVEMCLALATPKCRQLLTFAAEECTPKEIAELLQLKQFGNKKVSDDLSYCRERLFSCLEDKGIKESDWPF